MEQASSDTRNLKNFALPMILCNLAMEIEHILDKDYLERAMNTCIHEVMDVFYRPELGGIIVENVDINGNLVDCFEVGRLLPVTRLKRCGLSWIWVNVCIVRN